MSNNRWISSMKQFDERVNVDHDVIPVLAIDWTFMTVSYHEYHYIVIGYPMPSVGSGFSRIGMTLALSGWT